MIWDLLRFFFFFVMLGWWNMGICFLKFAIIPVPVANPTLILRPPSCPTASKLPVYITQFGMFKAARRPRYIDEDFMRHAPHHMVNELLVTSSHFTSL